MRKVLYVVAWLALVWVICSPPGAIALPQNEIYRTYYQEPEFLTEVGEYDFACHGKLKPLGQQTPYYVDFSLPCDGGTVFGATCYHCIVSRGSSGLYQDCDPVPCPDWILWAIP